MLGGRCKDTAGCPSEQPHVAGNPHSVTEEKTGGGRTCKDPLKGRVLWLREEKLQAETI